MLLNNNNNINWQDILNKEFNQYILYNFVLYQLTNNNIKYKLGNFSIFNK